MTIEGLPCTDIIIVHNLSKPKMMPFNFLFFVKPKHFQFTVKDKENKYSDSGTFLLSFAKWLYFVIPFTVLTYVAHTQFLTSSYHCVFSSTWLDLEEVKTVDEKCHVKIFLHLITCISMIAFDLPLFAILRDSVFLSLRDTPVFPQHDLPLFSTHFRLCRCRPAGHTHRSALHQLQELYTQVPQVRLHFSHGFNFLLVWPPLMIFISWISDDDRQHTNSAAHTHASMYTGHTHVLVQ